VRSKEDSMGFKGVMTAAAMVAVILLFASRGGAEDPQADLYQKSVDLEAVGKYQDALDALEKISGVRSGTYMYHLRRGWLLYLKGSYADSITAYEAAAKKEPGSIEALLGIMLPQLAARRWLDAEKTGKKVLETDSQNYLANSRLAYAYYNLGLWKQAEEHYRKVLSRYPGDIDMRSGFGWSLFKQGKHEQAKDEFRRILEVAPKHAAALEGIGLCP